MTEQPNAADLELIHKMSDVDLDSIGEGSQVHMRISKQAALEERHRRQKERDEKKEKTQKRILVMAVFAVIIALAALIVAIAK